MLEAAIALCSALRSKREKRLGFWFWFWFWLWLWSWLGLGLDRLL